MRAKRAGVRAKRAGVRSTRAPLYDRLAGLWPLALWARNAYGNALPAPPLKPEKITGRRARFARGASPLCALTEPRGGAVR